MEIKNSIINREQANKIPAPPYLKDIGLENFNFVYYREHKFLMNFKKDIDKKIKFGLKFKTIFYNEQIFIMNRSCLMYLINKDKEKV